MPDPHQQFVIGDATTLPGGVRLTGYRADGLTEGVHLGVPGASLTVILSLDGPVRAADTAAELRTRPASLDVLVAGMQERATYVEQPSHQEGVQLALDPLASRALFGVPASEVSATMRDAFDPGRWGRDLWQRVGELPSWQERFEAVGEIFAARAARRPRRMEPRADVAAAWRLLTRTRGAMSMAQLAHEVSLSERHLRTEFRRELGIGPKGAARLMRFEHASTRMTAAVRAGRTLSLAGVAADCGYADQSHLSREFRGYLGIAPSTWLAQERRNIQVGGHSPRQDWAT